MAEKITRRVPFAVHLVVPVLDVRIRTGEFLEGPAGWGEFSPLPSWGAEDQVRARKAATEAATQEFPAAQRTRVKVNAMVPRIAPTEAVALARASGCQTVKVKVGDASGIERVAAIRAALGDKVRIRLDANGAWTGIEEALMQLHRFEQFGIELVEDPVSELEELAELRRRQAIPVAAESCIRTLEDVQELVRLDAADALVLKPQRFGGVRACLEAAEIFQGPVIASSAMETSVGLSAVLALALALPLAPFAHGIGTAQLLQEDPSDSILAPIGGSMVARRVAPSAKILGSKA